MRYRRLLIVASAFIALLAAGGTALFVRQYILKQRALESRQRGLDAEKVGDYDVAVDEVGRYLQRYGLASGVEAMLA